MDNRSDLDSLSVTPSEHLDSSAKVELVRNSTFTIPKVLGWLGVIWSVVISVIAVFSLSVAFTNRNELGRLDSLTAENNILRTRLYVLESSWIVDPESVAAELMKILASAGFTVGG